MFRGRVYNMRNGTYPLMFLGRVYNIYEEWDIPINVPRKGI